MAEAHFRSNLLEEDRHVLYSIDHQGNQEKNHRTRCGVLQRAYDGNWSSRAEELSPRDHSLKLLDKGRPAPIFDAAALVHDCRFLFDRLKELSLPFWKVIFRLRENRRFIVGRSGEEVRRDAIHASVTVQFRVHPYGSLLEVGEGNGEGFKFNLNGLAARLTTQVENHRRARKAFFRGNVPLVLAAGDGAILFHEILGHALEADYVLQKLSPFGPADVGRRIMSPGVTLQTQNSRDPFYGALECDDEGERPVSHVLIEDGVLRHFIADYFHLRLLNLPGCGHCRVQDFSRIPMPRMFGLYLQPGPCDAGEILASTASGILAQEFGNGRLLFNENSFSFHIREAYLIENGRIAEPLGGIRVEGRIDEVLNGIEMIGNDFKFDRGVSYCYKNGQLIHVRVGQPTVRIGHLTVRSGEDA